MLIREIKKDIYWVGSIDWDLREFHGYETQRGSTYNAYLILDEKNVLIDTVKAYQSSEMMDRIKAIIDPSKIDYIVINHVEMDHSGALPVVLAVAPNAKIITNSFGIRGLKKHFPKDVENREFIEVKTGDVVNIGKRNLTFSQMQMVHWPDSMSTYINEDKILMPNDAFGQHFATFRLFDYEVDFSILMQEAKKYYANIVLPFGSQVQKALTDISSFDVEMICPSHGAIWSKYIPEILIEYQKWSKNVTSKKAIIVYDSMWDSTKTIAKTIHEALEEKGFFVSFFNLKTNHISDVITELLDSEYICVGSPTLNNSILPTVAGFLAYMKGLAPRNRKYIAFGSYGWSGQSVSIVSNFLKECGFVQLLEDIKVNYVPQESDLLRIKEQIKNIQ